MGNLASSDVGIGGKIEDVLDYFNSRTRAGFHIDLSEQEVTPDARCPEWSQCGVDNHNNNQVNT